MKVSCQACGAKYTIADEKVRGRKVKIRCKSCGTPIVVDGQSSQPPEASAAAAAPAAGTPAPAAAAAASPAASGPPWSVNLSDTDQRTMTTQEIVAGWKAGVVTSDAFVWRDGMGDWVAILECADLKGLLPAPGAAAAAGTPFGPTIVTAPAVSAPAAQARLAGGGRGGVDLFDATDGPEEEDVATSAPHLPMAGGSAYGDDKMTGARNENSVLFSLDSLKGGLTGSPEKKSAPKKSGATPEDPFAMGNSDAIGGGASPLFSLNANQALLTAPAPPEPPPPRFDASGAPAKPVNKLLIYGGAAGGAILLLIVGLLIGRGGRSDDAAPEGDSSAKAAASSEPEKKEDKKEEPKAEEKKEEPAPSATASASAPPKVAAGPTSGTTPGGSGGAAKSPGTSPGTTPGKTGEKKEEATAVGTAPFSVSAAQVALTQAASNAGGCAKPGGPTGSGKATVTFAPSGRVTTANVATPPFAGTPVGGCVAGQFRKARVPAFAGNPVTVSKSFSIK
jgi:predicted Zn finger-like uncharacterized protein